MKARHAAVLALVQISVSCGMKLMLVECQRSLGADELARSRRADSNAGHRYRRAVQGSVGRQRFWHFDGFPRARILGIRN
jgi:hypothetical protein